MKKLCIIKTGSAPEPVKKSYGDFEDMILTKIGISPRQAHIYRVCDGELLPVTGEISSIIITGSKAMVTDMNDWSVYLAKWLKSIASRRIPVLGICYGHQLIAQAFGGKVDYHPHGEETGRVDINLTEKASLDPLFKALPKHFNGFAKYSQTVVSLPPSANLLAQNSFEPHHAFELYGHIWGVQFHPEFTADIIRSYIQNDRDKLIAEGRDVKAMCESVTDDDTGGILLKRFAALDNRSFNS